MSDFVSYEVEITIPEYWLEKGLLLGGNVIKQLGSPKMVCKGRCLSFDNGKYTISINQPSLFEKIEVRTHKSSRVVNDDIPLLTLKSPFENCHALSMESVLEWTHYPNHLKLTDIDEIVKSWYHKFVFSEEIIDKSIPGLRTPQLGAVHAIASFLTVQTGEAATIVMPTGTGKTDTMIASMVLCRMNRILVIVPSDSLRDQLFRNFCRLGCLRELGAVPVDLINPRVAMIKNGIKNEDHLSQILSNSNVVIATPQVVRTMKEEIREEFMQAFKYLIVDEAHHVAASTWDAIKKEFDGKVRLQFTATPFRQDRKNLDGIVIYNFPLGEAQRLGYFKEINVCQVCEYSDIKSDEVIARQAVECLDNDLESGLDHILMARVKTKSKAEEIQLIYSKISPKHNPLFIHSGLKNRDKEFALNSLRNRKSRIIVCVDMLGEGFDLPNLKIASLHDVHKSLAITLQFIGRFTRTAYNVGNATVVFNGADQGVREDIEALYSENADWDSLLKWLSESKIEKEIKLQRIINGFKHNDITSIKIPLWNLRPTFSILVFLTKDSTWKSANLITYLEENGYYFAVNTDTHTIVSVKPIITPVKWGNYQDIKDITYVLTVLYWDIEAKLLYFHSSNFDCTPINEFVNRLFDNQTEQIIESRVFRVLSGVERYRVGNLGTTPIKRGVSYSMLFGMDVTEGITAYENSRSDLRNLSGWGYENGRAVTWGCSKKKGKVWAMTGGTILDFCVWCDSVGKKILDDSITEPDIVKGFMRFETMSDYYSDYPIGIQWGDKVITKNEEAVFMVINNKDIPLYEIDLSLDHQIESNRIIFFVKAEDRFSKYQLIIDTKGFEYRLIEGNEVYVKYGNVVNEALSTYLINDPVTITYIDGTISINNNHSIIEPYKNLFNAEFIEVNDWNGVDVTRESQGKGKDANTVQHKVIETIYNDYQIIIDDDSPGEAADIIALKVIPDLNKVLLTLFHCKFSTTAKPGARVGDLYELCGQAIKCIKWKHDSFKKLYTHVQRRQSKWEEVSANRFEKGSLRLLSELVKMLRTYELILEVVLVQPGLSKSKVTDDVLALLGSTEMFLTKTSLANLRVIGSP